MPLRTLIALAVAVPFTVMLLPALAIAMAVRLFSACVHRLAAVAEPPFLPWRDLIAFDERLGWKPRANLDTHYMAELDDVYRVVTDAEGWPGVGSINESRVLALGDSFAFGYGVDPHRSFAEVIPGMSVKAIGAPGYSMVQGVLLMEQLSARLSGKLIVWLVYPENDLQDNLAPDMRGYRAPFARFDPAERRWSIEDHHVRSDPWHTCELDRRRLFPRLCVPGPLADRAFDACGYLIARAAACCRAAGAELIVVTVPHPMQLTPEGTARLAALSGAPAACDASFPDRRLEAICREHRVPMIAGMTVLSIGDYKHREGIHWNERGHRRVAQLLRAIEPAATRQAAEGRRRRRPEPVGRGSYAARI